MKLIIKINKARFFAMLALFLTVSLFSAFINAIELAQLISLAIENNPEAARSKSLLSAAQSDIDAAEWQYYPTPSVEVISADVSASDQSFLGDDYVATVGLVQPLWSGGLITSRVREAESSFKISNAENQQTLQDLSLRVLTAYTEWSGAHHRAKAWEEGFKIHQRLYGQVKRRTAGGASSDSDLALAQSRVLQIESELVAASAEEESALADLIELIGRSLSTAELLVQPASSLLVDFTKQVLIANAQQNNPIIQQRLAAVELAENQIKTVTAERMPEINLRLERQFGDLSFADSSPSNRIFVEFSSRFGAGLSVRSQANSARLRLDAASANVEAARRSITAIIASEYALKKSVDRRLIALRRSEEATRDVYESFERQFLSGSRSWLDLLNSARELTQVEVRRIDVEMSSVLVSWRLSILTQGLQPTLEKVS
ncbi:MAG: adhesin transport system outer membrane protein [Flavobacteriales bacterium]